jgi:diaminopimelate epimerase
VEFLTWGAERKGKIRLHNADGSIAEISGNGTRCVAAWIGYETKAGPGDEIMLETDAGLRTCRIVAREGPGFRIASAMGVPELQTRSLHLAGGERIEGAVVSTGNPHFVIFVDQQDFSVNGYAWEVIGEEICSHPQFPQQTNVEFVRMTGADKIEDEIEIRIYERGVGPTSSSGTGTCATGSAAIALRGASPVLRVIAPGGPQTVEWHGPGSEILLTGPAELVCFGEAW